MRNFRLYKLFVDFTGISLFEVSWTEADTKFI